MFEATCLFLGSYAIDFSVLIQLLFTGKVEESERSEILWDSANKTAVGGMPLLDVTNESIPDLVD